MPHLNVPVKRGMTHDGLGNYLSQMITKAPGPTVDIVKVLKDTGTEVVVNYLPVGSEMATKWYVEQILEAGCGLVNCMPGLHRPRGLLAGALPQGAALPVIGDDIKSQVGATITHRVLTRLFRERGVKIDRTYQLNFGGNTDFLNMLERERLRARRSARPTRSLAARLRPWPRRTSTSARRDYVPWLNDRKWATSASRASRSATCR